VTQLNLAALPGLPARPDGIPVELAVRVRDAAAARDLQICALSGTYNMAHPDSAKRRTGLAELQVLISTAPALGAAIVTLCTGTRDTRDMWRHHPDNLTAAAWSDMCHSLAEALTTAQTHDIVLAIEPERNNVVHSASAARRLFDELRSPYLKAIIDPANLIDPQALDQQRDIITAALDLLNEDLVLAHAKDLYPDGTFAAAGRGRLDYDTYLDGLHRCGYNGPLLLHGLAEHEVTESVAFLHAQLDPQQS
jgi:sugar phosphate isomerase/epimerase